MCKRYLVNREDLGKRVTGYIFFDADTKGFVGMTEKQIKEILSKGDRLYGLMLDGDGNIAMDKDGWHTNNYMVRSGINSLTPAVESDCPANMMYVVVGVRKNNNETVYEVVNSRYARVEMSEVKIKMLAEFGALQGGAYMENGELVLCDGVVVIEATTGITGRNKGGSKGMSEGTV